LVASTKFEWTVRTDCSRLRRSSCASLRTAAANAATSDPARRLVVEPSCYPSAVGNVVAAPSSAGRECVGASIDVKRNGVWGPIPAIEYLDTASRDAPFRMRLPFHDGARSVEESEFAGRLRNDRSRGLPINTRSERRVGSRNILVKRYRAHRGCGGQSCYGR
jgi:hypothetical protein